MNKYMNKYQKLFVGQMEENLGRMLAPDARTDERSVYRLLHSVKGTSGTIGLQAWYESALRLLERFREDGERTFGGAELSAELAELSALLDAALETEPPARPYPPLAEAPGAGANVGGSGGASADASAGTRSGAAAGSGAGEEDARAAREAAERTAAAASGPQAGAPVGSAPNAGSHSGPAPEAGPEADAAPETPSPEASPPGGKIRGLAASLRERLGRRTEQPDEAAQAAADPGDAAGQRKPSTYEAGSSDREASSALPSSDFPPSAVLPSTVSPSALPPSAVPQSAGPPSASSPALPPSAMPSPAAASAGGSFGTLPESSEGTVLLLDDDLGLLALLKDVLEERGFTVFATPRFDKAVEWFYEMRPDCAVLDVLLPGQSGFELIGRLRELCDRYMIPIVLMTAKSDDETRLRAYEEGADDFLTKPMNPEEFVVRIRRLTRRRRRITGQLLLDQTTGAYGMPFLERELTRQIGLLEPGGEPLALAAVELDGLRRFNERTGYREGDRLLRAFSDAVRRQLRPRDVWARDRSNRFYLLQPGLEAGRSAEFLREILQADRLGPLGFDESAAICGVVDVGADDTQQEALSGALRALETSAERFGLPQGQEGSAGTPASRQLRLALIDDDPLIRTILERQLQSLEEEYPIDIRSFADGEEFLSDPWHAEGSRYLLVLDRMMPRMNGMEVLARLRSGDYAPVYTVLMLTGVGDERGIAEAIRAGTDDYMTKPFSMVELEARVRRLIGKVAMPS
ncbi:MULTISPECIES: response regulator transcription factor [Saccharibacillus]|uniref:response regulator transcription factor n=1 Tax=Saccharibacillus TaxID=456492 RepID=UPI00136623DC|nr:response regulator [Saccharibacillus sp. WB 17]